MVIVDVIGKLNGFADNISDLYEVSLKLRAGGRNRTANLKVMSLASYR